MGTIEDLSPHSSPRDDRNAVQPHSKQLGPLNPILELLKQEDDEENPPEPLRIKPTEASFSPYLESSPYNNNSGKRVIALNESALKNIRL